MASSRKDSSTLGLLGSGLRTPLRAESPEPWERRVTGHLPPPERRTPDHVIHVIVKVARAGHVPAGVTLRARLSPELFTAATTWRALPEVAADPLVASIALAEPIGTPEPSPSGSA